MVLLYYVTDGLHISKHMISQYLVQIGLEYFYNEVSYLAKRLIIFIFINLLLILMHSVNIYESFPSWEVIAIT